MLFGFLVLLICQLAGELLVRYLDLPFPGPVVGMVFLLAGLMIRGRVPEGIRQASEGLLSYLALLFVPAGVGLMVHFQLIAADGLTILTALILSTAITMLITGFILKHLALKEDHPSASAGQGATASTGQTADTGKTVNTGQTASKAPVSEENDIKGTKKETSHE